jgi:hypothetical protein
LRALNFTSNNEEISMKSKFLNKYLKLGIKTCALVVFGLSLASISAVSYADKGGEHSKNDGKNGQIMWLNHFGLQSGDTAILTTTSNSPATGVFPDLSGLVIQPATAGASVVQMALDLPKNTKITGVKVCYGNSAATSFISQISLAQMVDPATADKVIVDDTDLTSTSPVCVNSKSIKPSIKSKNGPVLLSLGITAGATTDKIVIRGLGVYVK